MARKQNEAPEIGDNHDFEGLREYAGQLDDIDGQILDLRTVRRRITDEVKASGHNVKVLNIVLRRRRRKAAELSEEDQLIEMYEDALKG